MITGLLCQPGTIVRMCRLCASVAVTMPISGMSTSGRTRVPANSLTFQASFEVNSLSNALFRRPSGLPVQGVLLLVALLPRRRPDDEDREQLLCVDGAT